MMCRMLHDARDGPAVTDLLVHTCHAEAMGVHRFRLPDLEEATQNFSPSCVIGEGGFGQVFLGTLLDGTQVAIKTLDPQSLQVSSRCVSSLLINTHHTSC